MPGQNTTLPVAETATSPQTLLSHAIALSAHNIEPELLLPTPRPVVEDGFWRLIPDTNERFFLRNGRAVPAIIVKIEPLPKNRYRVVFNYVTQANPRSIEYCTVTADQATTLDLYRGKTFTLLVSPTEEHHVLPYFLSSEYRINEPSSTASTISRTRPLRPATHSAGSVAADPGVERELYGATPRRVVWNSHVAKARIVSLNKVALVFFVGIWIIRTQGIATAEMPLLGIFLALMMNWAVMEIVWRRQRRFLQNGYATVATITSVKSVVDGNETQTEITYRYPLSDGKMGYGKQRIVPREATHLRSLHVGAQFTVLRHPDQGRAAIPYFKIDAVAIPGAPPPQIKLP